MNGHKLDKKSMPDVSLCKKCGRCCRIVVNNDYTYRQLKNMADDGDTYAQDFINLFTPYSSIEEARKVDNDAVENIIQNLKQERMYDEQSFTLYKCKYIMNNNLCSIYEERPPLCAKFPSNGWITTPPECGYTSWLFIQREADMQKVRKAKEELFDLKVMKSKTQDIELLKKIETVEKKIDSMINSYARYGSRHW